MISTMVTTDVAKNKKKKEKRPQLVAGVRMSKVDEAQLDQSIEKLEIPAGGSLTDKVRRIASFFQAQKADEYDQCDKCGGSCLVEIIAPLIGEVCPYCAEGPAPVENSEQIIESVPESQSSDELEVVEGTENDLNEACKQVEAFKINLAKGFWQLGRIIEEIHKRKLWQYRVGPDNAPLYTSFESFVRAELNMSDDQAYKYIEVYRAFNEGDIRELGISKLHAVLKVPPGPMREKLLAAARNGASKRDIEREAAGEDEGDDEEVEPDKVTIALMLGSVRLPMWKRKRGKKSAEAEAATSVKDDAYCTEDLPNGVVQTYRLVQKPSGQIVLVIDRVRNVE